MSDFDQEDIRSKLQDLKHRFDERSHDWNDWEYSFVESVTNKLQYDTLKFSDKQINAIHRIWGKV